MHDFVYPGTVRYLLTRTWKAALSFCDLFASCSWQKLNTSTVLLRNASGLRAHALAQIPTFNVRTFPICRTKVDGTARHKKWASQAIGIRC
ncbi:unnamed protein product [Periconia digitata]|uniref:Uncharacterized protein n=1 Tax=Periconia digitata TaxID=1303443 RepID=A0A9W4XL44_9PLEO|nr:unnamed protein product [Periconia digitata]